MFVISQHVHSILKECFDGKYSVYHNEIVPYYIITYNTLHKRNGIILLHVTIMGPPWKWNSVLNIFYARNEL